jgi:membrane-bound lytic murein transglycosylase MltF
MNFQQKTEIASLRSQGKKNVVSNDTTNAQSGYFTDERIRGDLHYRRAQEIAQKMLNDGLISVDEFNKLTVINCETFSPLFAEIMPKLPRYVVVLE